MRRAWPAALLVLPLLAACDGDFGGRTCDRCQADAAASADAALPDAAAPDAADLDPCAGVVCDAPPDDECSDDLLTDYAEEGSCAPAEGEPRCEYSAETTDCRDSDRRCQAGACVDPCQPNPCTSPPAARCTGPNLHRFPSPGACASPEGEVACEYSEIVINCAAQGQVCSEEAADCVDP